MQAGRGRAEGWKWGGCSHNVRFGETVARQFLETGEEGGGALAGLASLHNSQAGRLAVRKTLRTLCKCHGVSGSCATQTCWRQIPQFQQVRPLCSAVLCCTVLAGGGLPEEAVQEGTEGRPGGGGGGPAGESGQQQDRAGGAPQPPWLGSRGGGGGGCGARTASQTEGAGLPPEFT